MKKSIIVLTCFMLIAFFGTPAMVFAGAKTLSILTWEGYAPKELCDEFTKETGIKVEVSNISSGDEIISKLRATGGTGYDLVNPNFDAVKAPQMEYNLYQPLDLSKIKVTGNIIPAALEGAQKNTLIDGKQYGFPYMWGTSGIIVNTQKINKKEYSTLDLYDEEYCGRTTYRYRYPTFFLAGYGLGWDVFANYDSEWKFRNMMENILEFLISKKKCVKTYWTTRQENIDLMESGECSISQGWDGTGWYLSNRNPHIKFIAPKEGGIGWLDVHAIPSGAENPEAAYKWINFLMTPERAARVTKITGWGTAVAKASDFLPESMKKAMEESYPPGSYEKIHWYLPTPPHVREIYTEMEERLKQAR